MRGASRPTFTHLAAAGHSIMKAYQIEAFGFENVKPRRTFAEPQPARRGPALDAAWSLNFRDLMMAKGQYNPRLKLPV